MASDMERIAFRIADRCKRLREKLVPGTPERYPATDVAVPILDVEALLTDRAAREEQLDVTLRERDEQTRRKQEWFDEAGRRGAEANETILAMQHQRRLLMHEIKGVYALLNNNRTLSDRRTPEQALAEYERVVDIACDRLREMFE